MECYTLLGSFLTLMLTNVILGVLFRNGAQLQEDRHPQPGHSLWLQLCHAVPQVRTPGFTSALLSVYWVYMCVHPCVCLTALWPFVGTPSPRTTSPPWSPSLTPTCPLAMLRRWVAMTSPGSTTSTSAVSVHLSTWWVCLYSLYSTLSSDLFHLCAVHCFRRSLFTCADRQIRGENNRSCWPQLISATVNDQTIKLLWLTLTVLLFHSFITRFFFLSINKT